MRVYEYGDPKAEIVLIQPTGAHELAELESEVAEIGRMTGVSFWFLAYPVNDWNCALSPWKAPAVFGNEGFGEGAAATLTEILSLCRDNTKRYYIGGYSLAGLFALWAAYQTDVFAGIAAASPSVWFPGFIEYMKAHSIRSRRIYLSLGDREGKTRNPVMAEVGKCIREAEEWLQQNGIQTTLEWNSGGHFRDSAFRTARAFAWIIKS